MRFKEGATFLYLFCHRMIVILSWIWFRYRRYGYEDVPKTGGFILASNHASFLDPPLVGIGIRPRIIRFFTRDTLLNTPLKKWFLTKLLCVPVDRTKGDLAALRRGIKLLQEGIVLGVFPEGTRTKDGELQSAKGGIGFMISKAGVPVVPAYIQGSYEAFPRKAKFIRPKKIRVFYGKPITVAEVRMLGEGKEAYEKIGDLVMERIAQLKPAKITTKTEGR